MHIYNGLGLLLTGLLFAVMLGRVYHLEKRIERLKGKQEPTRQ